MRISRTMSSVNDGRYNRIAIAMLVCAILIIPEIPPITLPVLTKTSQAFQRNEDDDSNLTLVRSEWLDKKYTFHLPAETAFERTAWKRGESPQCGPRSAEQNARKWIEQKLDIAKYATYEWYCGSIELSRIGGDAWFWIVRFSLIPKKGSLTGYGPEPFRVAVLADGTIPDVSESPIKSDDE